MQSCRCHGRVSDAHETTALAAAAVVVVIVVVELVLCIRTDIVQRLECLH